MKKWMIASLLMFAGASVVMADAPPAKSQTCVACHGAAGESVNPEWPNLAGQHEEYLAIQIRAFRDGTRANPAMAPFVKDLSDADIEALAAYYSKLKPATAANGKPELVAVGENLSGYCKACHGMEGVPVANAWPIIAGQHAAYLQKQLAAYKSGERVNSFMQAAIGHLGDAEFEALAAYYSQLQP